MNLKMFFSLMLLLLTGGLESSVSKIDEPAGAGLSNSGKVIPTTTAPKTPATLIIPIDAFLRSLRENQIETTYTNTTSIDFKKATSFDTFKAFVDKYPILINHKNIQITPNTVNDNEANISVILDPGKNAVTMNFLLVKEGNEWKIWNVSLTPLFSDTVTALLKNTDAMHVPIEEQLKSIHEDHIAKAYQYFTSEQFRKTTTLDAFRAFVKDYPILQEHVDVSFKEPVLDKGTSLIEAQLDTETSSTIVEYTLGIEEDQWKIWSMRVLKQSAKTASPNMNSAEKTPLYHVTQTKQEINQGNDNTGSALEITEIDIGNSLDVDSKKSKPTLKPNSGDIHVNIHVQHGILGTKIELHTVHIDSHTNIPPISTSLEQDGNIIVSIVFSPPLNGWPRGNYLLTATSSTGAQRTLSFSVE